MFSQTRYKSRLGVWFAIALGSLCAVQFAAMIARWQGHSFGVSPVQAQESTRFTEENVTGYANTVAAIEPLRVAAYGAASDTLVNAGSEVSLIDNPLRCTTSEVSDMPGTDETVQVELLTILVKYCNEAKDIAEANGLTPQMFNTMTAAHREDSELASRIRAAIPSSEGAEVETVE